MRAVEKLLVRKSGMEYLADIHVQVDAGLTLREGYNIGHEVKNRFVQQIATVRDVVVHLETFSSKTDKDAG